MSVSGAKKQGDLLKIVYAASPAAQAVAIPLLDPNDVAVTISAGQRLSVDSCMFNTDAAADTADLAYLIEAATAPAAIPATGVVASFSIAPNLGQQGAVFPGEGYECADGNSLWLYVPATTLESANVTVTGVARKLRTGTHFGRQPWQAGQVNAGNVPNGQPF